MICLVLVLVSRCWCYYWLITILLDKRLRCDFFLRWLSVMKRDGELESWSVNVSQSVSQCISQSIDTPHNPRDLLIRRTLYDRTDRIRLTLLAFTSNISLFHLG